MKVKVISVINRWPDEVPYFCHREFLKSVIRGGTQPTILEAPNWLGLMTKPRKLQEYLRKGNDADCLIVVDAWDLVFASTPMQIASKWAEMGSKWTIGGERALFPNDLPENVFPECESTYRFPNSGCIISTPSDMLAVLEAMDLPSQPDDHQRDDGSMFHGNDQLEYQKVFVQQPVPMVIDTNCDFVWNLCGVDESNVEYGERGMMNRETGAFPMMVHLNGNSKTEFGADKMFKFFHLR